MNKIPTLQEYLLVESKKYEEKLELNGKREIFIALSESVLLTEDERSFGSYLLESEDWNLFFEESLNEESIADKIKAKAQAALATAKERGKNALSKTQEVILKMGGNIKAIINKIMEAIKGFLSKSWEYIKGQVESKYEGIRDKILESAKGKFKGKQDVAKEEIGNLSSMTSAGLKWATGGVVDSMSKGLEKASSVEESYTNIIENVYCLSIADMIREDWSFVNALKTDEIFEGEGGGIKIPFLSSLAKRVANYEPFKTLHNVEHLAEEGANKGLSKISSFMSKVANAPGPFEFVVIGAIFGLITGYAIKAGVKSLIQEIGTTAAGAVIVSAIPGIGIVLMSMKYTAKGIWCVAVCEQAIGIAKGDKKPEEESDKKEDENKE